MSVDHSAAGALAGYMWQLRMALLHLLELGEGSAVEVETFDDVVGFRQDEQVTSSLQTKHHQGDVAFDIRSADIWKTLRAWIDTRVGASGRRLVLVTTGTLASGSPLQPLLATTATLDRAPLAPQARQKIRAALDEIAQKKPNTDLQRSYEAWARLTPLDQEDLLDHMSIVHAQDHLEQAHDSLKKNFSVTIPPDDLDDFVDHACGWFDRRIANQLHTGQCRVTWEELAAQLHNFTRSLGQRPQFATHAGSKHPALEEELATNPVYLRQLGLLNAGSRMLRVAATHHFQGTLERNDLMQKSIHGRSIVDVLYASLCDRWQLKFATSGDPNPVQCGWRTYEWCMSFSPQLAGADASVHLTAGSYHYLADHKKIGWHPDYEALLALENGDEE